MAQRSLPSEYPKEWVTTHAASPLPAKAGSAAQMAARTAAALDGKANVVRRLSAEGMEPAAIAKHLRRFENLLVNTTQVKQLLARMDAS